MYVVTATQNLKDFRNSSPWTCSTLMAILRIQHKNTDYLMILDPELKKTSFNNYDIVLCTETWKNENSVIDIAGFDCLTLQRTRRAGAKKNYGGIVVYFCSELSSYVELTKTTGDCIVWVRVRKYFLHSDTYLLLCTCCVLPSNSCRINISCDVFQQLADDVVEFKSCDSGYIGVIAG